MRFQKNQGPKDSPKFSYKPIYQSHGVLWRTYFSTSRQSLVPDMGEECPKMVGPESHSERHIFCLCILYTYIMYYRLYIYMHNDRKLLTLISIPACGCLQPSDTATWQFGFVRKVAWSWQPRNWDDVDIDIDIDIDICICTCICLYCMCNMLEKLFYQFGNSYLLYYESKLRHHKFSHVS